MTAALAADERAALDAVLPTLVAGLPGRVDHPHGGEPGD